MGHGEMDEETKAQLERRADAKREADVRAERVADLKQKHGVLLGIDDPVEMYFKKPSRAIWADFLDSIAKQKGTHEQAYRRLCLACCVYPEKEDAGAVFDELPGLTLTIGDQLGELCGHKGSIEVKKL